MHISKADKKDIPEMVALINSAYRGEASQAGWTTEANIISGELRTDETNLYELMNMPGTVFLKYSNAENKIEGCVFLQKQDGKLYLGMLSVSPVLQAQGTGKRLMAAAEQYAKEQECPSVFMRVISTRNELIAWYERQHYYKTGEIQPFTDGHFGKATEPIEFIVMEKPI